MSGRTERWHAVAWYRSEIGLIDVHHSFEELSELHELIERGPSWQALDRIEIQYVRLPEKLTIEEAQKQ